MKLFDPTIDDLLGDLGRLHAKLERFVQRKHAHSEAHAVAVADLQRQIDANDADVARATRIQAKVQEFVA